LNQNRRQFLASVGVLAAGSAVPLPSWGFGLGSKKLKVVLVGTGIRGTSFWGKRLVDTYPDLLEFVGLCDINEGRLKYALEYMNVNCPTFTVFEQMINKTKPDLVIVTTKDSTHDEFIVKGLQMGCDVLTEKPMTTDEVKCQKILDAEKLSDKKLIVGFNYRWNPYMTKIKEILSNNEIGKVTSVDFNWYLNTYHGASYFRRWHGELKSGGSLWVHKATHHFDLLNWWLDSDPSEVFAYGDLEHYGNNGPYKGENCRSCQFKSECKFYWDITENKRMMDLYVKNEKHDGYIRDNCLFREDIDIYDKMSCQIKYANNTTVNYSLTTYSPFEGWRIAFNGTKGRLEAWLDIPYNKQHNLSQEELHAIEMKQGGEEELSYEPMIVHKLWTEQYDKEHVGMERSGHGGGDKRLHNKIFKDPDAPDIYGHFAGIRDGAMSCLIGIAARKSIQSGKPIRIAELTDLKPSVNRK
jgi:predicted dehydrogenase